ncbi:MAG: hypothetical protein QXM08_03580 [Thermofilaceae archaeon]
MSQVQTPLKIEVPREKAPELYRFTDLYLRPKRFVTVTEYQRLIGAWSEKLISLVFRDMCDAVFDLEEEEVCPVDVDKVRDEIFSVLENSPEIEKMTEELDVDWGNIDPRDNDIHVDDKVEITPVLRFENGEYKVYLVVDRAGK